MFTKLAIFIFVFIATFVLLWGQIPDEMFITSYSASVGADPEIIKQLDAANVTVYSSTGSDNMTFTYASVNDGPSAPDWEMGLPEGEYLNVWWDWQYIDAWPAPIPDKQLQFQHIYDNGWVPLPWPYHKLKFYKKDGNTPVSTNDFLDQYSLEETWDENANASIVIAKCSHITASVMFMFNMTKYETITQAWNDNELNYILSYDVNWNATNLSAWNILTKLLTFQAPDLGMPGNSEFILSGIISIPLGIILAILILKLIQSMIPFIKGIND